MPITRDDLLKDIKEDIEKVFPDGDEELDADTLDTFEETVNATIKAAEDNLEKSEDEEDEEDDDEGTEPDDVLNEEEGPSER